MVKMGRKRATSIKLCPRVERKIRTSGLSGWRRAAEDFGEEFNLSMDAVDCVASGLHEAARDFKEGARDRRDVSRGFLPAARPSAPVDGTLSRSCTVTEVIGTRAESNTGIGRGGGRRSRG